MSHVQYTFNYSALYYIDGSPHHGDSSSLDNPLGNYLLAAKPSQIQRQRDSLTYIAIVEKVACHLSQAGERKRILFTSAVKMFIVDKAIHYLFSQRAMLCNLVLQTTQQRRCNRKYLHSDSQHQLRGMPALLKNAKLHFQKADISGCKSIQLRAYEVVYRNPLSQLSYYRHDFLITIKKENHLEKRHLIDLSGGVVASQCNISLRT